MFRFLKTDIKEQKSMKREYRHPVNDLRYEIKFENRVKDKDNFFIKWKTLLFLFEQKYILFLEAYFLKIPKNLITSAFFLSRQIPKNIRYVLAKTSNAALVKLTDWIIKQGHVINRAMFFCKW